MLLKSIKSKQVNKRLISQTLSAYLLMYFFLHIFECKSLFIKKIKRLEISLITSFTLLLISWKDEIPILFLDFTKSRSEGNKPWYLLMSSFVYMLKCLSPTESNGMKSDTQEITLFGWKAIASSISFLTEAPTPSICPLPCPDSVKTQQTLMLFSTANRLVKKALHLLRYWLVGLSDITYKYFSCSKLNDSRTFSKDA